jgi:hypothetical protein
MPAKSPGDSSAPASDRTTGSQFGTRSHATSLKPFSKEDVRSVADALINQNGSTTTLDVKHRLCKDGFFAEQRQVSNAMKDLASVHGWTSRVDGNHLVYTVPPELEPPSVGSSFEAFYSSGPGDNARWALIFRILNSGSRDLTIRRAVYFLDPARQVPILPDAKRSNTHPMGFEVKFGEQWKLLECSLKPGEETISYVPLRKRVTGTELPQGTRGSLLLEYVVDGRTARHQTPL